MVSNYSPVANVVYWIVVIQKTSLCNGKGPIKDPITEMEVAHAFELNQNLFSYHSKRCFAYLKKCGQVSQSSSGSSKLFKTRFFPVC